MPDTPRFVSFMIIPVIITVILVVTLRFIVPDPLRFLLIIVFPPTLVMILLIAWVNRVQTPRDMRSSRQRQRRRRSERELPPEVNSPRVSK